jgi:thioredoxin
MLSPGIADGLGAFYAQSVTCPSCGGAERRPIGLNFFECTSQVAFVVRSWAPRPGYMPGPGVPMEPVDQTEYKVCGHHYTEGAASSVTPTCACGMFAIGRCVECGEPLCGKNACHALIGGRMHCREHARAAREAKAESRRAVGEVLIIDVTDQTFNTEVIERSQTVPVVVYLWAEWAGPCQQFRPVLEKLAWDAKGGFTLAKVDVDANPQVTSLLKAQSIPMVLAVKDGNLMDSFLGAMPEAQLREWLDAIVWAS